MIFFGPIPVFFAGDDPVFSAPTGGVTGGAGGVDATSCAACCEDLAPQDGQNAAGGFIAAPQLPQNDIAFTSGRNKFDSKIKGRP
jgi:hypothetical protein